MPGAWCQPTDKFRSLAGTAPEHAAAFVLSHSGPAANEQAVIHVPNDPASHCDQMFSEHPAGANVVFGDGSTRLVAAAVARDVWAAACSSAAGETAAAP